MMIDAPVANLSALIRDRDQKFTAIVNTDSGDRERRFQVSLITHR
jgi:hypothetical protein